MLDFSKVRSHETTTAQLAKDLTLDDLRRLTNEMVDLQLELIAGCVDADVTFVPDDPAADDHAAATPEEVHLAWTLGHVIVHVTASAEEAAAGSSELARSISWLGRSRSEVPWQTVTTIAECRARLQDSRRMRLAYVDTWPTPPDLENTYVPWEGSSPVNATDKFIRGLSHDDSHLEHIRNIVAQARAARR
jgi:DinB superfamily